MNEMNEIKNLMGKIIFILSFLMFMSIVDVEIAIQEGLTDSR